MDALEETLRQAAPPLGRADPARVTRACERLAALPAAPVRHTPHVLSKPLIRIAASLVLFGSAAVLLRTDRDSAATADLPHLAALPSADDLNALVDVQPLTHALACESDNLISDLTALADVLNDRSLAILF